MQATLKKTNQSHLDNLSQAISNAQQYLISIQDNLGRWSVPMEGSSVLPEAHLLIANACFNILKKEAELYKKIINRIRERQNQDGTWSVFKNDGGHLSTTVEAYLALLLSGISIDETFMKKAAEAIKDFGGIKKISSLTKATLAITGQIPWKKFPAIPIDIIRFSEESYFNIYDFVSFTRIHVVPLMVLAEKRFTFSETNIPSLNFLDVSSKNKARHEKYKFHDKTIPFLTSIFNAILSLQHLLSKTRFRQRSLKICEKWIIERQEPDGTWGSYILSTFFSMCSLLALGYKIDDPRIKRAKDGLKSLVWKQNQEILMQPCTSTIWTTAITSVALQETGISANHPAIKKSTAYLADKKQTKGGDWQVRNKINSSTCWGFQDVNEFYPDVDDTAAVVRAIKECPFLDKNTRKNITKEGLTWVLSMQNKDGGWASFDRNCTKSWLEKIPFNDMRKAMIDPSTADLAGRVLEFLGSLGFSFINKTIIQAITWLEKNQEKDGSWFGRWGVAYIYGTWCSLSGLASVGFPKDHPMVEKAILWLKSIQNSDGGWGESCASDIEKKYIPLGFSTASQTAWALIGLASFLHPNDEAIIRGFNYLTKNQKEQGCWNENYTTGTGFSGKLYLDYRIYKDVWPLSALGLIKNKCSGDL